MKSIALLFKNIRQFIWKRVPEKIKPFIRYVYYGARIPFNYRKNLNTFRFVTALGQKEHINYAPLLIGPTICSVCNLRCNNCLYLIKDENVFKGGGFMKVEDYKTIIDKYAKDVNAVFLGGGEPLLHPELNKIIEIAKSKGLPVRMSSNGILINKKIDAIKKLDLINVSIDSYDYESFYRARGGTKEQFSQIIEGLDLLKKNNIKYMISFILSEENIEDIYKMLNFAYKHQPSFVMFHNINPHGSKEYSPLTLNNQRIKEILKDITSKSDYPFSIILPVIFNTNSKHFLANKCPQPWNSLLFDDKGDIAYCCHLRHDKEIGNILKGYDFNSKAMREFRRAMSRGEYSKDDCLYCQRRFAGEEYGNFDSESKKWTFY